MFDSLLSLIPVGTLGAAAGWFFNAYLERKKLASADHKADLDADVALEKHRDNLTFELLSAARTELSAMRQEVEKLRPMESHFYHLQQALEHLDALLNMDEHSRVSVERNARAFLNRIRRLEEAKGTIINEVQRVDSAVHLGKDPTKG